ncbi:MAG: anti-sigma factor [Verrucomicrobia bacterium]|nr:anti-sigma factor [Verrucomicrobiota bacterium]
MNCENCEPLLSGYLDYELDLPTSLQVEQHLQECESCRAAFERQQQLQQRIEAAAPAYQLPDVVRARVTRKLRAGPLNPGIARRAALAFALLFVLATVGLALQHNFNVTEQDQTADRLLSAHLRSLLPDHLVDVQSTDLHTVKPWFDGRISFSPQVLNLDHDGYVLVGGRLDYVGPKEAAVIVYRYRDHIINLFIYAPDASPMTGVRHIERAGYNCATWQQNGFLCSAMTDASREALDKFIQLQTAG